MRDRSAKRERGLWLKRLAACMVMGAAFLWAAGCGSTPPIAPAVPIPRQTPDLATVKQTISESNRYWATLEATCDMVIMSPQIRQENNQEEFTGGKLLIQRPGKISLAFTRRGQKAITLVGDGQNFRVLLPIFADSYRGAYGQSVAVTPTRILLLPGDLSDAWDPVNTFLGKAQVIKRGAICLVDSLKMVTEPRQAFLVTSSVAFNAMSNAVVSIDQYNDDGLMRSQTSIVAYATVPGLRDEVVKVPAEVLTTFPASYTRVRIRLRNIKLNAEIDPAEFSVGE